MTINEMVQAVFSSQFPYWGGNEAEIARGIKVAERVAEALKTSSPAEVRKTQDYRDLEWFFDFS